MVTEKNDTGQTKKKTYRAEEDSKYFTQMFWFLRGGWELLVQPGDCGGQGTREAKTTKILCEPPWRYAADAAGCMDASISTGKAPWEAQKLR